MTAKRFTTKNIICSNYCVWDNNDKPYGNDEVVELLNELHEELEPIRKICEKYRIPIKDLPEILEEYIAYDNDDDW